MRHFGTEKFKSYLLAGTFFAGLGLLNRLADSAIVGHLIGEDAFAGINMVSPVLSTVLFFSYLISVGTATNYSIWMGRLDRRRARGFFTQGLVMALVAGVLLSAVIYFLEGDYFLSLCGSEYVEMYGRQYMDWIWPTGITSCLLMLLSVFCCADGDIRLCSVANGLVFVTNAAVSYLAVDRGMGASGCAMGTVVAETVGILVLSAHFFRRVNTFAPVWRLSLSDAYLIVRASFGDALSLLCDAILFYFLNKLVIAKFDSDLLPIASLAIIVWRFMAVSKGVGFAAQPLVTVYWGERNTRGIRKVMQTAMTAAAAEGLILCLAFLAFPGLVIGLAGLEYPDLIVPARQCVMLTCGMLLPLAFAGLFNSYFLFIERPVVSIFETSVSYLLSPMACAFAGSLWGFDGIWVGLGLGPLVGVSLVAAAIFVRRGRRGFPLMLPRRRENRIRMFDLELTPERIVGASKAVAEALPPDVAPRAALVVEEVFMTVLERNRGRRRVLGEVTLDLNDGVLMTLRDDGMIFDITDADAKVSSLRTYLVASLMRHQMGRLNLVTSGFNRNVFRFA